MKSIEHMIILNIIVLIMDRIFIKPVILSRGQTATETAQLQSGPPANVMRLSCFNMTFCRFDMI